MPRKPATEDMSFDQLISNLSEIAWYKKKQERTIQRTTFIDCDIGWKLPTLSMRYLFQNSCLLFGRVLHVVGEEKCGKTSFCFDLIRRFMGFGIVAYIETEGKLDKHKLKAFLFSKSKKEIDNFLYVYEVNNLDECIGAVLEIFELIKDYQQVPLLLIIDSIRGVTGEDIIKSVTESGTIDRSMPVDALKITKFLEVIRPYIRNKPYLVIITNHLKKQKNPYNPYMSIATTGGGKALAFLASWKLEVSREDISKSSTSYSIYNTFTILSSNICEEGRSITVPIVYTKDKDGKEVAFYDWETASISLLVGDKLDEKTKEKINQILPIQLKIGKHNKKFIVSQDLCGSEELLSFSKAGALLEREELKDKMRAIESELSIIQSVPFVPGKTMEELIEEYYSTIESSASSSGDADEQQPTTTED
jgi:RecA/RadA recombinase